LITRWTTGWDALKWELADAKLTTIERTIELILREYKEATGKAQLSCARA